MTSPLADSSSSGSSSVTYDDRRGVLSSDGGHDSKNVAQNIPENVPEKLIPTPNIPYITKEDYFRMLRTYALSHRRVLDVEGSEDSGEKGEERKGEKGEGGKGEKGEGVGGEGGVGAVGGAGGEVGAVRDEVLWIDENQNPFTGESSGSGLGVQ